MESLRRLASEPGVVASSGPYPYTQRTVTVGGLAVSAWLQGRDTAEAAVDQPRLVAGEWARAGGAVLESSFAAAIGAGVGDRPLPARAGVLGGDPAHLGTEGQRINPRHVASMLIFEHAKPPYGDKSAPNRTVGPTVSVLSARMNQTRPRRIRRSRGWA